MLFYLLADHRVLFAYMNSFFKQELLKNEDYTFNQTLKKYTISFKYELFPFSFASLQDTLKVKRENQVFVSAKMSRFEFSIPGLGKYCMRDWCTQNPLTFQSTGNAEVVRDYAKKVWAVQDSHDNSR